MELIAPLLDVAEGAFLAGAIVFLRIGGAMALLPAFGELTLSVRVKLGLALALTVIVAPVVAREVAMPGWDSVLPLVGTEAAIGLVFGLILRLLVLTLQIAGTIAAQSTSLAQLFGGASAEPLPAIGHLLVVSGLALVAMTDLHLRLVETLIASYDLFPPGTLLPSGELADLGVAHVARAFSLAFTLAAPFVIGALVYNLALGAINRAMPQLMVAFVGAPAITGLALALLALVAPIALAIWAQVFADTLANPFGAP